MDVCLYYFRCGVRRDRDYLATSTSWSSVHCTIPQPQGASHRRRSRLQEPARRQKSSLQVGAGLAGRAGSQNMASLCDGGWGAGAQLCVNKCMLYFHVTLLTLNPAILCSNCNSSPPSLSAHSASIPSARNTCRYLAARYNSSRYWWVAGSRRNSVIDSTHAVHVWSSLTASVSLALDYSLACPIQTNGDGLWRCGCATSRVSGSVWVWRWWVQTSPDIPRSRLPGLCCLQGTVLGISLDRRRSRRARRRGIIVLILRE